MGVQPFPCERCQRWFLGDEDLDAAAEWLSVRHPDGRLEVICPGCATALDREREER